MSISIPAPVKANASPGEVAQSSTGFVEHDQVITLYAVTGVFLTLAGEDTRRLKAHGRLS